MAVQYDEENGFTTWFSRLKEDAVHVSDEIKTVFKDSIPSKDDNIGWHDFIYDLNNGGIDDFIEKHNIADENFKEFLNDIGNAKFDMKDYQQWLVANGKATSTFTAFT